MLDKNRLKAFEIFADVPRDKLEGIAHMCRPRDFEPREVIFNQDDPARDLYPEFP